MLLYQKRLKSQLTEYSLFDDRIYPNCDQSSPQAQLPLRDFSIELHLFDHNSIKSCFSCIFVYSKE